MERAALERIIGLNEALNFGHLADLTLRLNLRIDLKINLSLATAYWSEAANLKLAILRERWSLTNCH